MAKTWEQLTQEEKVEDVHRDVLRLFDLLNQFQDGVARHAGQGLTKIAGSNAARERA